MSAQYEMALPPPTPETVRRELDAALAAVPPDQPQTMLDAVKAVRVRLGKPAPTNQEADRET